MKDEGRRALLKAMLATSAGLVAKRLFASPERGSMLTRKIPSSGEEIPVVGVGTSGAFEVGESAAERAPIEEVVAGARGRGRPPRGHLTDVWDGPRGRRRRPRTSSAFRQAVPRDQGLDDRARARGSARWRSPSRG
jgi:hypothetical protein